MPRLTIQARGTDESWVHECTEPVITIGRMNDNVVQLRTDGVSRRHARISLDGEQFFLTDLKSGNGTFLNGLPVAPSEKHLLKSGDVVSVDAFDLRFQEGAEALAQAIAEEVTESDLLEVRLLKKVLTTLDRETVPSIEILNGAAEGKKFFLTDEVSELVLGRDPECSVPINEHVISRRHARIVRRWGGIAIRDMESKNGTFINNRRIVEEFLHDGDRIALGTIVILFRNPQEINLAQMVEVKPRYRPAPVRPEEIPGAEGGKEQAPAGEPVPPEGEDTPEPSAEGDVSAIEEWDQLEKSLSGIEAYPAPKPRASYFKAIRHLTPVEIGMMGLGALVLLLALITIVNLLAE